MTRILTIVISGAVGVGLGALSGRILFDGSAWNMVPWAIVAITIGLVADNGRTALLASGIYGYLLVVVFLFAANTGDTPFAQRALFALALGLVGPVCSIALTVITRLIRFGVQRHRPSGD